MFNLTENHYLRAIRKGDVWAMANLGLLYDKQGKQDLAEKYYLLAGEKGNDWAMTQLGLLYHEQGKHDLAEKYYLLASEKGNGCAMDNLGLLYHEQGKHDLANSYFSKAKGKIKADKKEKWKRRWDNVNGISFAMVSCVAIFCAFYYYGLNRDWKEADNRARQWKEAADGANARLERLQKETGRAMFLLGEVYANAGQDEAAEHYFLNALDNGHNKEKIRPYIAVGAVEEDEDGLLIAVGNGDKKAMWRLGCLYVNQGRLDLAEKYWGLAGGGSTLGILCEHQGKDDLAEKYYLQACKSGTPDADVAITQLGRLYARQGKRDLAVQYYLQRAKSETWALEQFFSLKHPENETVEDEQ